jgi:hypothetical protein
MAEAVRPAAAPFRFSLARAAKEAIWLTTLRHRPGSKRSIALFAGYRGGSTWLLEMLSAEPGVRHNQ